MPTQNFAFTGAIQTFIVPPTVTSLTIRAVGARGGDGLTTGGRGAYIQGDFPVTPGEVLSILVGGAGGGDDLTAGGGGGGSFVWRTTSPVTAANILIAAGGGGGGTQGSTGRNANESSISGQAGNEALGGAGGVNGLGGGGGSGFLGGGGAGGAGIVGNGANGSTGAIGGTAINAGGAGGGTGGFGGGGAGSAGGGGGGGYSGGGGGGGTNLVESFGGGGGGGSFNAGINQKNVSGVGTGDGIVVITFAAVTLNFTGELQTFVVPPCVTSMTIQAVGARGGGLFDFGRGAFIQGDFSVTPGEVLTVLVGGMGSSQSGGGGTFVWRTANPVTAANLLVAAGGGGGQANLLPGRDAVLTTSGTAGAAGGAGGINGLGGSAGAPDDGGGGGAGIVGNGFSSPGGGGGGTAINAGGAGGAPDAGGGTGGFGGGGGGGASGGGGGGGFSGGGGGNGLDPLFPLVAGLGGGGGSFNGGSNQLNLTRIGLGNGQVIISFPFVEPPTITCPPDMSTGTDPGVDFGTVTYMVTATSPGCGIVSISCSPSGVVHHFPSLPVAEVVETMAFPRGMTVVTCTATDAAGNTSSCSFTVTVTDVFPTATPPIPNNLEARCIMVQEVYDWVVSTNRERSKVSIPDEFLPVVDEAIQSGQDISIQCIEPVVPPPFPLFQRSHTKSVSDFSCSIVNVRRVQMTVNQTTFLAGMVQFVFQATVLLRVFANGDFLFEFPVVVMFDDEVILCLPEPLDENNISCRITGIECTPNEHFLLGGRVELEVIICKEIQVHAEVKMEVLGKFCSPRPNNIPAPTPTPSFRCPSFGFPRQCPSIFPSQD